MGFKRLNRCTSQTRVQRAETCGCPQIQTAFAAIMLAPRREAALLAAAGAPRVGDEHSIAVLPFLDLSQAKDQEYFSDGLSEELLNLLAQLPQRS